MAEADGRRPHDEGDDIRMLVLENFLNAWRVPDLRTKLLFTAAMLAVYRLGSHLPAPGVNPDARSICSAIRPAS